ncbi:MAG: sugar transferase [Myxococcales bacterium]|nr:sugar transferase [Myxococcales bacterium]
MDWKVKVVKRAIDVVGASVGLAVTAPFFPLLAAVVYLDNPGPIFYSQVRVGRTDHGTQIDALPTFKMWKFRSMRVDAEKGKAQLAGKNDDRITRVGRVLRKTRLDELPQFWNVLRGDMSIVGPRPERPELVQTLSAVIPMFEERTRDLRPGITGLAQVSLDYLGRIPDDSQIAHLRDTLVNPFKLEGVEDSIADDMRTKLLYDLAYAMRLEDFGTFLKTDLEVMFKTPLVMLGARGR